MEKIELLLDNKTLEKARTLAEAHHCDLSELVAYAILKLEVVESPGYQTQKETNFDLNQYAGVIKLDQDPLEYQQKIRDEWS